MWLRGRSGHVRKLHWHKKKLTLCFPLVLLSSFNFGYKFDLPVESMFGQLPEMEVDGTKLCQSQAIERLLAKRFGKITSLSSDYATNKPAQV